MSTTRMIATAPLTEDEKQMLAWAVSPALAPPEGREFRYYLDVETLPATQHERVVAVTERILGDRLDAATQRPA